MEGGPMVRVPSAATSAMRLPDWRYHEAVRRVDAADKLNARVSDRWVGSLARFLGNRQSSPTHAGRRLLKAKMPATATALDLALEGGELRVCVEARILAGDLPDWIAHESGIPVSAIEMFERIFFDVRRDRNRSRV